MKQLKDIKINLLFIRANESIPYVIVKFGNAIMLFGLVQVLTLVLLIKHIRNNT